MPFDLPKCDICEQKDAQLTCVKCEINICKICDEKHHSKGKLKEHQRDPYTGTTSRFCTIKGHEKQTLALFCQTCSKLICGTCVVSEHKVHTWLGVEVATENAKNILKNAIKPLQENITGAQDEIKKISRRNQSKRNKNK